MVTAERRLLTNDTLIDQVDADGCYRLPASLADYWERLADADYRVDYADHHFVATMPYESDSHSIIAAELNFLLRAVFADRSQYVLFNSNRPVFIESLASEEMGWSAGAVFNADGMVVGIPRYPAGAQPMD